MRNYILSMECRHHSQSEEMRRIYTHPPIEKERNLTITVRCRRIDSSWMPGLRSTQLPRLLYKTRSTHKQNWKFLLQFKAQNRLLECYSTGKEVELFRYMMYQYFEKWLVFEMRRFIYELQKPINILLNLYGK